MSLITLTTDFGAGSAYVAAMKGVIYGLNPAATIVDITHDVPPQDVRTAAWLLADSLPWFPPSAVHVVVVDPEVGTARDIVYAEIGHCCCLAPDNGVLSRLAKSVPVKQRIRVTAPEFWLPLVSATFHGRDIFAPVAARLSLGLVPEALGEPCDTWQTLAWPQPVVREREIMGLVQHVDRFGNLITNVAVEMLPHDLDRTAIVSTCAAAGSIPFVHTYGERPTGTMVGLVGSSGLLEVAVVNGSAAAQLQAGIGTEVKLTW